VNDLDALAELVAPGDVMVLSGAGISTESGIPDYRGPTGLARRATPMTYQTFTSDPVARRRYWARSHLGWQTIARAHPNRGHASVAALERRGLLSGIVTQNVDGLHQSAGAQNVVELHGSLSRVVCLDCRNTLDRDELHKRLHEANPAFQGAILDVNPDGDVELSDEDANRFTVVGCTLCPAGMLKPDVVFFGESVPRDRVQACFTLVERSKAVLVLGSSLTVMSGRRFVLRAVKHGIPVAIVNQGATRSDDVAAITIDAPLGVTLTALEARLAGARAATTTPAAAAPS
jgi:NAD-dependent SIR2 family protein deacetylase